MVNHHGTERRWRSQSMKVIIIGSVIALVVGALLFARANNDIGAAASNDNEITVQGSTPLPDRASVSTFEDVIMTAQEDMFIPAALAAVPDPNGETTS